MDFEYMLINVDDGIATITINRPETLNALSPAVYHEISEGLTMLASDSAVKAVIITGAGDRAFIAGADIAAMSIMSANDALLFGAAAKAASMRIESMAQPVIAAVNGLALGGGCELALTCDFRVAVRSAKFGQPEINLGIIPGNGGTQRLTRLVGISKAKEMIMLGDMITAEQALQLGLVHQVVEADELMPAALQLAKKLSQKAPIALAMAKRAIQRASGSDIQDGLEFELNCFAHCFSTQDQKEGMKAFLEKRPPQFSGS
ncbi:MAG: enoyl-CoA hydratase-related protein [Thermincola sp.]|jgi:enoyl-CoA hydratase|nr:enoyl-CoA hydratase-related protein [Thermincola sp.]MDT3702250.1 enoyl-CoA hydratase-related protein [Thermincola sp.]